MTGNTGSEKIARVYNNTGGSFSEATDINLTGVDYGKASFGDYDNDGDLDILITGDSNSGRIARIYRNNYNNSNASPAVPTALTAVVTGQTVLLSWSAASDAETITSGLNYNLRIGSSSGGNDILSPMALPLSSGYRLIPERGMFQNLTATVKLPAGTYYWSVQSIDTAFAGSEFATETTFVVEPTPPSISSISSQSTIIDYPISIAFQLTDVDGGNIGISASSSDLSLVSIENISFTGANMISDGLNYTIQSISDIPESITMIIDLSSSMAGSSVITITFDDCGTLVQTAFDFSDLSPFTEDESIDLSGASRVSNFFDYDINEWYFKQWSSCQSIKKYRRQFQ